MAVGSCPAHIPRVVWFEGDLEQASLSANITCMQESKRTDQDTYTKWGGPRAGLLCKHQDLFTGPWIIALSFLATVHLSHHVATHLNPCRRRSHSPVLVLCTVGWFPLKFQSLTIRSDSSPAAHVLSVCRCVAVSNLSVHDLVRQPSQT